VKLKESTQWFIFFLRSRGHSDGSLHSESDHKYGSVSTNMNDSFLEKLLRQAQLDHCNYL